MSHPPLSPEAQLDLQYIEDGILAYRYLYYVKHESMIPDHIYDEIERKAKKVLPPESLVHRVGSDLFTSYTPSSIAKAQALYASIKGIKHLPP